MAPRRPAARRVRRRRPLRVHRAYSQPFAMLVVADLLGVPEADHQRFREGFGLDAAPSARSAPATRQPGENALGVARRVVRRRTSRTGGASRARTCSPTWRSPRIPTGRTPDVTAVVRTATFLFAAGQETTARLLAAALKYLAEHPELQDELRAHREPHPRLHRGGAAHREPGEGRLPPGPPRARRSAASRSRPARRSCCSTARPTGTRGASSARPSSASTAPNAQAHIAFGRGAHACPGGPLARAEGRVSLERILDRMRDIRLSEEHHGPPGDRRFDYEPTWVLRGLTKLHLEFDPHE